MVCVFRGIRTGESAATRRGGGGGSRGSRGSVADTCRWSRVCLLFAGAHDCTRRSTGRIATAKSVAKLARVRLQRIRSRSSRFVEIFPRQSAYDFARNDRRPRENLCRLHRLGIHAYPGPAHSRVGADAVGDAAAKAFDTARGSGSSVARSAGSRIVRDLPAHALRGTKTVFTSGLGIAHGDSRHDPAQVPRTWRRGNLHGNGAPRAPQRACEFFAEIAEGHLYGI